MADPTSSQPNLPRPADLVERLLPWIESARRDLPWRRRRDPYAVWVSEVMLQQTQAATVAPYFERWMGLFPDVASLATAPEDAVLKAWEGLGYYARARNLQRAARLMMERHGGALPSDPAALRHLPGVGRYTAGAILSLAFGQAEPVLDGNVRRVLCRIYDIAADPRQHEVELQLWRLAREAVDAAPDRAGDVNEALMELGALVCTPGVPDCPACPVNALCLARLAGVQTQRPLRAARAETPHRDVAAAVIQNHAGYYLIARRAPEGLLGGLWEFPGTVVAAKGTSQRPGESLEEFLARELAERLAIEVDVLEKIGQVTHGYTHLRITLHAYHASLRAGEPAPLGYAAVRWVRAGELAAYPFPVTHLKIRRALGVGDNPT